jgi:hypothetical protein
LRNITSPAEQGQSEGGFSAAFRRAGTRMSAWVNFFFFEKNDAGTRLISLSDPDMLEEEKESRIKLHERWFT